MKKKFSITSILLSLLTLVGCDFSRVSVKSTDRLAIALSNNIMFKGSFERYLVKEKNDEEDKKELTAEFTLAFSKNKTYQYYKHSFSKENYFYYENDNVKLYNSTTKKFVNNDTDIALLKNPFANLAKTNYEKIDDSTYQLTNQSAKASVYNTFAFVNDVILKSKDKEVETISFYTISSKLSSMIMKTKPFDDVINSQTKNVYYLITCQIDTNIDEAFSINEN